MEVRKWRAMGPRSGANMMLALWTLVNICEFHPWILMHGRKRLRNVTCCACMFYITVPASIQFR